MKYIKKYNESSSDFKYPTSEADVDYECYKLLIRKEQYAINSDFSINFKGHFQLDNNKYLKSIGRLPIKFNEVRGDFNVYSCGLTTLEGCPKIVGRYFNVRDNKLTNLDYFPNEINGEAGILLIQNKITMINPDIQEKYGSRLVFTDNPIHTLLTFLYKEGFKISFTEMLERLIEFDVVKGNDIDQINLERLYNFYELPFGLKISGYNIT